MKRILLLTTILLTGVIFAQDNFEDCNNTSKIIKNDFRSDKSAVVIWEEDFGGGFPSGWSSYSNNTGAGNSGSLPGNTAECQWKYTTVGSWGYWNTNQGQSAAPAINSTTSSNGFLISDIDSANHWNAGQPSGNTYYYLESYFTTSAIDLTGFPNVSLEFEHSFRFNNSINLEVSISTDSLSWTTYNVQGNATNNQASADPEYLSLNISSVAGNSPTAYIKIGWTARCYFWMIDDMKIVETPDNKIDLTEITHGGWYTTPTTNGFGLDYSMVPLNQAVANPFTFEGIVTNLGALDQTTSINVNVFNSAGVNTFSTSSADSILGPQDTMTFVGQDKFTPSNTDNYSFDIWATSLDTISDTMSGSFEVTNNIYARDNGNDISEYGLGRSCGGMVIGNYFDIYEQTDVSSLSVYIKDNSVSGAQIFSAMYEIDASNDKIYLVQSDDYTLTNSDIGSWVTVSFDDPVTLLPGTYMAAFGAYANPVDTSVIGMSQYTYPTTSYIQKNGCLTGTQTFGSWYWLSRAPMIRMNFASVSSIEENVFSGKVSIYPNPSSGILNLDMIGVSADEYSIKLINILGEVVYLSSIQTNGIYNDVIDISELESSTYILQIENENYIFTDKIIIK